MAISRSRADPVEHPGGGFDHHDYDVLLVGAGLANSIVALMLSRAHRGLSIGMIERDDRIGGNHTWSFHTTDIDSDALTVLEPMLEARWPDQEIRFPKLKRILSTGYNAMTSERLHDAVMTNAAIDVVLSAGVKDVSSTGVALEDGRRISARCVIDGRGARATQSLALGYQKFVGLEVELVDPHGMTRPVIMDATVAQHDGYRFVYTLPFSPTRILIEDTYYSDGPDLDVDLLASRAHAYAAQNNWRIARMIRQEQGVLPITLAGDIEGFWAEGPQKAARSGMRACLFHPTTGYSLPDAVLLAQKIAASQQFDTAAIDKLVRRHSHRCWNERSFFRFLNRMLFLAARGDERRTVLERFYALPQPLIERFYAGQITSGDKVRILMGRPPLPIPRAMRHMSESQALAAVTQRLQGQIHG
ncbi:MAG: lycopene beta-cyclase CrtY [Alphaproteobacteria bacterium]|nr:lycopene beta-cyclase CrtY [Alphaproteobacteria bacterium]